jgi:transposase
MPDNVQTLLQWLADGKTLEQAARQIGVSRTTAYRLVQRFGRDAVRRTKPPLSPETRARIRELRVGGKSIRATARMLRVSRYSVRKWSRLNEPSSSRCQGCGGRTTVVPCPVCEARRLKGIK